LFKYTRSPEGRLLSQSIRPGRDTQYSYSKFNISHYGRLLIRLIRPSTETYITISTNKHLFTVDY
ncbi:hypothetical protein GIB67_007856, partial [Kingdonia uniflora]